LSGSFIDLAVRLGMAGLVILLRDLQTSLNHIDVELPCPDAVWRLLLKGVQHMHDLLEANRVDGAVGVFVVVLDHFEHARALTLPGFGGRGLPSN
jgi:hypothetical protein